TAVISFPPNRHALNYTEIKAKNNGTVTTLLSSNEHFLKRQMTTNQQSVGPAPSKAATGF
ncbi:MAG: hypothetical protein ABF793_13710, partial [Lacticaseibacillus paracasei]